MRYLEIDGLRLSRIGLGTWQFGSREWGYGDAYARDVAPALLARATELGITMIDTAEIYGPARSERIIGTWLAGLDAPDRAVLTVATKLMPIAPLEPIVEWQASGSLRRLGEDALDLYYIHWPNPFVSSRRVIQSIRPLVADGRVRRVGVSNHSLVQWRQAERALGAPVIANQVELSLLRPEPLRDLIPYAAEQGRVVVAYSPLAQGLLADRDMAAGRDFRRAMRGRVAADPRLADLRATVREVAAVHDATAAQIALAWVLAQPATIAIPGARTLEQLEANAAAAEIPITPDEVERLTAAAEAFADRR